jgi:hypothetical protein
LGVTIIKETKLTEIWNDKSLANDGKDGKSQDDLYDQNSNLAAIVVKRMDMPDEEEEEDEIGMSDDHSDGDENGSNNDDMDGMDDDDNGE